MRCCPARLARKALRRSRPWRLRQARFALPTTLVQDGMDAQVAAALHRALQRLSAAGAQLVELAVPEFDELAAINAAGGFSAAESWAWHAELIERSGGGDYDPRVITRILRGRDFTARAYLALQAQQVDWQRRVANRLDEFDGWLMPTVPLVAPRIADAGSRRGAVLLGQRRDVAQPLHRQLHGRLRHFAALPRGWRARPSA